MSSISPRTLAALSNLAVKTRGEGHAVEVRPHFIEMKGLMDGGRTVERFFLIRGDQVVRCLGATVSHVRSTLRATASSV